MAVDPNIKKKANDIRNKVYGKEVRESLASGLEAMSSDVVETVGRQDEVESQWQNVVDETTGKDVISAPEIIAARDGEANLKARLDKENQEVNDQLAEKATLEDVNDLQVNKADKIYVNDQLLLKRNKAEKIGLEDLSEETLSAMSGDSTFEINSIPQEKSVSISKLDNDLHKIIGYKFTDWELGKISTDGKNSNSISHIRTITPRYGNMGDKIKIDTDLPYNMNIYIYSLNGNFITSATWVKDYTFDQECLFRVVLFRHNYDVNPDDIPIIGTYIIAYFANQKPIKFDGILGELGNRQIANNAVTKSKVSKNLLTGHLLTNGIANIILYGDKKGLEFLGSEVILYYVDEGVEITQRHIPFVSTTRQALVYDLIDNQLKFVGLSSTGRQWGINDNHILLGTIRTNGVNNIKCNNVTIDNEPFFGAYDIQQNGIMKQYLLEELRDTIARSNTIEGDFKFAFSTDIHICNLRSDYYKLQLLSEIGKYGNLNFICNGGDTVDGFVDHQEIVAQITQSLMEMRRQSTTDIFICQGNHDTGFVYFYPEQGYGAPSPETALTPRKWHNLACRHLENAVQFDRLNPYGGYYYKDYSLSKIRTIILNTTDNFIIDASGTPQIDTMSQYIQQKQLEWLYRDALCFMDKGDDRINWGVIILSHNNLINTTFGNIARGIIKSYMDGDSYSGSEIDHHSGLSVNINCDFTEQGPMEFICSVNGHVHYDSISNDTLLNRPRISTLNAVTLKRNSTNGDVYDRNPGEISAEAIDIITINKEKRKIYTTRFGAGVDREVNY